jgi:signal transduction histidine kinase
MTRDPSFNTLVIGDDTTSQASLLYQLREAEQRAEQAERLAGLGQRVAILAHEARNALQQTMVNLQILAREVSNQPEVRDLVAHAHRAQQGLARLFEDVRSYAAPVLLESEVLNLRDVWLLAWSNLASVHQEKEAELREEIAGDLCYSGDRFRLEQVFRNLFENALAACPARVQIEVCCGEGTLHGRPAIQLAVRDNGHGLSPEQRKKAFEPFYTTKSQGTGLGLAVTKRIIEAHGGQIAVGAVGSGGAEFVIILPRHNTEAPD